MVKDMFWDNDPDMVVVTVGVVVPLEDAAIECSARPPRWTRLESSGLPEMIVRPPHRYGPGSETQNRLKSSSSSSSWSMSGSLSMAGSVLRAVSMAGSSSMFALWSSESGHGHQGGPGLSPLDYLR